MQLSTKHGLTLIPPSPVSHCTPVEIRAGLVNPAEVRKVFRITFYVDRSDDEHCLYTTSVMVEPKGVATECYFWRPGSEQAGRREIIMKIRNDESTEVLRRPLLIVESSSRSLDIIAGAFSGFCHWSETEGRLWNDQLRTFTEDDWRSLVRAQCEVGMNILVPQESFRNQVYVGDHSIDTDGYKGLACYDSKLYSGRMDIATADPLRVTLEEADNLGMQVFLPVGMYAWFDFTEGSLKWHKQVATELWQRYGHHDSFYGWYVSEEIAGDLGTDDSRREELVHFFEEFTAHCRSMAPEKPVMLATNCHGIRTGENFYTRLLSNLDIICPFGFQRMPDHDLCADEAASVLQELCDAAGAHLWLDMEAFNFHADMALYPRPITELVEELNRRLHFEKIICYQFPGMFNPDWATKKPGGPDTVRLYADYQQYVTDTLPILLPNSMQPDVADSHSLTPVEAQVE